ncbi:hypothetical protein LJC69_06220, partial [Bacteroidales bacterium OttesenSCG-928-K22]|nr:hypothetical protein [Bacteroidales bacterium OttesenSCG-928-K22]
NKGVDGGYFWNRHSPIVQTECNYGFTKWLDAGLFFGILLTSNVTPIVFDSIIELEDGTFQYYQNTGGERFLYKIFNYGLNANTHILSLILKPSFLLIDVYANSKVGLQTTYAKEIEYNKTGFYCSIGGGIGINFSKEFGIICEYNYYLSKKLIGLLNSKHYFSYGINIRF